MLFGKLSSSRIRIRLGTNMKMKKIIFHFYTVLCVETYSGTVRNEKSGARASGGAGASCECRVGGNVSWGAKDSSKLY